MHLVGVLAVLLLACGRAPIDPPDLVGVWRTEAPSHRDRKLEVQPDWIVFGTGGESSSSYRRDGTEVEIRGQSLICTLHYLGEEGDRTHVRLVFEPGPPDKLRFENQSALWVREADASWLRKRG
jgi:hypothetical protein